MNSSQPSSVSVRLRLEIQPSALLRENEIKTLLVLRDEVVTIKATLIGITMPASPQFFMACR